MSYKTQQEEFWAGEFGDAYNLRNHYGLEGRTELFTRALASAPGVSSAIELGANVGLNLLTLRSLLPDAELRGVEINAAACADLAKVPGVIVHHGSLLDASLEPCDLAFTSGVLIHINPDHLATAYRRLYEASRRYVLVAEYYNPSPVTIAYRGHEQRLFKRDWAGELMDAYPDLALLDYGFFYKRDPLYPLDDLTWFLLEKRTTQ